MLKPKIILALTAFVAVSTLVLAQDTEPKLTPPPSLTKPGATPTNAVRRASSKQGDVASKTAKFGMISKTDETYKTALDAHALAAALKQTNKDGAFKGKVTQIFEPRGGAMAIMNFDTNYRNALTALLKKDGFDKFPALTNLLNQEVLVSGKFINYQGRAEIILTNATQIKLVE